MEGDEESSLVIAMEDESFEENHSDEYDLVGEKNGRVKRKSKLEGGGKVRWNQRRLSAVRKGRKDRQWAY